MINHIYTQEKEGQMMKLKNYYQSVPILIRINYIRNISGISK